MLLDQKIISKFSKVIVFETQHIRHVPHGDIFNLCVPFAGGVVEGGALAATGGGGGGGAGGGAEASRCAPPPAKRPNKHPQPMQRPSAEQYAAMCARAQATGQPLPKHIFTHVSI